MNYIYIIKCPKDNSVIYVGQTYLPKSRFSSHMSTKSNAPISKYIRSLKLENLKPIFEIVKEIPMTVDGLTKANYHEQKLIKKYKKETNSRLLNRYLL